MPLPASHLAHTSTVQYEFKNSPLGEGIVRRIDHVIFVSFSGIDGAGKSTQIHRLCERLREMRLRIRRITFWTDVAALTRMRERLSYGLFRGDQGVGSPERPLERRDKNVQAWYLTVFRCSLYLLDAIKLKLLASTLYGCSCDVVIFDRYIYDELANLPLQVGAIRKFVRFVLKIAPKPDLALLLNANAAEARARKPEYPEDFLERNRATFLELAKLAKMTVIPPQPVEDIVCRVEEELIRVFSRSVQEQLSYSQPT
jgi:thymidylate kinase